VDVDGLQVSQCGTGVYIYAMAAGSLRNVVCTDNTEYGLLLESSVDRAVHRPERLFTGNGEAGIRTANSTVRLEQVTSADNLSYGLESGGTGSTQLVNCVLSNPVATSREPLPVSGRWWWPPSTAP
jgi:hypothetical protein